MWADVQRDVRLAEYTWRPLRKFRNSIPCTKPQRLADPAAGVSCSNAANMKERKTQTQSEFCTWQNSLRDKSAQNVFMVYQPRRRPKIVQSLVGLQWAKMRSRWNLLGFPKLANRSQPLVSRSSPYCELEKILLFNKFFSDCRYMP